MVRRLHHRYDRRELIWCRVPELVLPASHPKRAFMRRLAEAYHDRILDTLPEVMAAPDAGVLPSEAPEPVWPYEREGGSSRTCKDAVLMVRTPSSCRGPRAVPAVPHQGLRRGRATPSRDSSERYIGP
jgi:hypothetical protein